MRSVAEVRSRLFARAAAIALISAGAAGCTGDISRFADSPFSGSMAALSTPAPGEHTASLPVGRIDSQPLPAPPGQPNVASTGSYASPRIASHAPITTPAQPRPDQAGGVHVVAPGETLSSILFPETMGAALVRMRERATMTRDDWKRSWRPWLSDRPAPEG